MPTELTFVGEPEKDQLGSPTKQPVRPMGKWAYQIEYDPEHGCRAEDFEIPVHEYMKRFVVPATNTPSEKYAIKLPGNPEPFFPLEVEGVFQAPVSGSGRWKPVRIENKVDLRAFNEANRRGFQEAFRESDCFDYDSGISTDGLSSTFLIDRDEFVPFMNGPFYKQLFIRDFLLMNSRAFQLVNHNALAAAAVKILTRFTLGRGISFHIKDEEAKAIWDEFWERNNMRRRLHQMARDLTWAGEIINRFYEKDKGYITLRVLDASTMWEIVTDLEDLDRIYYGHFQWAAPFQIYVTGSIPVTKYIIQQIPPTNFQQVKINASSQEKRGRSDLLPAMSWLKRLDDYYNGRTLKAVLEANLVWKILVKGDQADVDAFQSNPQLTQLPPPGGVWIENEAVTLTPVTAAMTSAGRGSEIGDEIAALVATSLNLPREYFNLSGNAAARATALVRTDPAVKTVEDRQQLLRETLEEIYDRVLSAALLAGRITRKAARHEPETVRAFTPKEPRHMPIRPLARTPIR